MRLLVGRGMKTPFDERELRGFDDAMFDYDYYLHTHPNGGSSLLLHVPR
jgi:hypothetical protein